jgi:hypothetical protein
VISTTDECRPYRLPPFSLAITARTNAYMVVDWLVRGADRPLSLILFQVNYQDRHRAVV